MTRRRAQDRTDFVTFPQLNPPCLPAQPTPPPVPALLAWLRPSTLKTMGPVNAWIYGHENKYIKRARKRAIHETLL